MEESADPAVVDGSSATKKAAAPKETVSRRKPLDKQVTSFQAATAMPDLLDPPSDPPSDPSTDPSSDPSTSDDTSPFLGTPYSTSQQFDYPFPISNAPRDPGVPPPPLPSALPIASSLASAPSIMTAAASSDEASESAATSPLPSMVSTIAASLDLPNNISELRSLHNQSSSSLNSTHSGHTNAVMIPVASSGASIRSMSSASPSSSFQSHSHVAMAGVNSTLITSPAPRQKGRHSLSIFPMPPPPLSIHTNVPKPTHSPHHARRQKAMTVSSTGSTGSESTAPPEAKPTRSRPPSGSHSSLSIASMQLLSGPGEPPIPPSLLSKLNRPRNTSSNSTSSSYFSANAPAHQAPNSRDFFSSPGGDVQNASAPSSPPPLGTDSSVEFFKPTPPANSKSSLAPFRPFLGRSNSSAGHGHSGHSGHTGHSGSNFISRPLFTRSTTANPQLQSRAYAQHLRHQQQQQLKLQEEQRKKAEKEKEKKEKKEKKGRRSSLSLTRSQSSSSSSSAKTKSSIMSKSPSSTSIGEGSKLSPTQRSIVENAISESEGSASPEGTKVRRRSSVRRVLEKTGSLVGFNLSLNAAKRATANP